MSRPGQSQKSATLLIVIAFGVLPLLLLIPVWASQGHAGQVGFPPFVAYGIAGASFLIAVVMAGKLGPALTSQQFQQKMIVTLSVAEFGAMIGFVASQGHGLMDYLPFAVGASAIDLLYILPRALAYWSREN